MLRILHCQREMSPSRDAHHHGIGPPASSDSVTSIRVLQRHQGKDSPHFQKAEETSQFTKATVHALTGCTPLGASCSPSTLGRSAVGSGEKVCCSFPERLEEQSNRSSSPTSSRWELRRGLNPGCPCPGGPLSANLPSADARE